MLLFFVDNKEESFEAAEATNIHLVEVKVLRVAEYLLEYLVPDLIFKQEPPVVRPCLIVFLGDKIEQSIALVFGHCSCHQQLEHLLDIRERKGHFRVHYQELDERHHHFDEVLMGCKTGKTYRLELFALCGPQFEFGFICLLKVGLQIYENQVEQVVFLEYFLQHQRYCDHSR